MASRPDHSTSSTGPLPPATRSEADDSSMSFMDDPPDERESQSSIFAADHFSLHEDDDDFDDIEFDDDEMDDEMDDDEEDIDLFVDDEEDDFDDEDDEDLLEDSDDFN